MKLRELVRELLIQELGDTRGAYNFRMTQDPASSIEATSGGEVEVKYEFTTDTGTEYTVRIYNYVFADEVEDGIELVVEFWHGAGAMSLTDEGDAFRVVGTVADVVEDFVKNHKEETEAALAKAWETDFAKITSLVVDAIGKAGEEGKGYEDMSRTKLYRLFAMNRGFDFDFSGRYPTIELE